MFKTDGQNDRLTDRQAEEGQSHSPQTIRDWGLTVTQKLEAFHVVNRMTSSKC